MNPRLALIGDALEDAAATHLAHTVRRRSPWRSPRVAVAAALTIVALPAAAYAATSLLTNHQVARSVPAGTGALIGTDPSCSTITPGIEYHCLLAAAPRTPAPATSTVPVKVAVLESGRRMTILTLQSRQEVPSAVRALRRQSHVRILKVTVMTGPSRTTADRPHAFNWTGTVEPTVDATRHVNGGCRAENASGTSWECYVGQAAVTHNIIGLGLLGHDSPTPGLG